jgi:hypothetical protein
MRTIGYTEGRVCGRVVYANFEKGETKTGKVKEEFKFLIKLPNDATIGIKSKFFGENEKTRGLVNGLMDVVSEYKTEDIYLNAALKKDKTKNKNVFDTFSAYKNDEGKLSYTIECTPYVLKSVEGEDSKVEVNYGGDVRVRDVKDLNSDFTILGYFVEAEKIDDENSYIHITDGELEYANKNILKVSTAIAEQLVEGAFYGFKCSFVKGGAIEADVVETKEKKEDSLAAAFDFSGNMSLDDFKKNETKFEDDYLLVKVVELSRK